MEQGLQALRLRVEPSPGKGFFRLPWEIRHRIYELSLIELPKWEKLHSCERPPFINRSILYTALPRCDCAKRHSLNLLLANRQVNNEAAAVFWSRNVFCFTRASDLTDNIGKHLRPRYRLMLRHLVLLLYTCDSLPNKTPYNVVMQTVDDMWNVILQCNGLRTLDLNHHVFSASYDFIKRIPKQMPELESLTMSTFMAYRIWPRRDQSEPDRPAPWTFNDGEATNRPPRLNASGNNNNNNDAESLQPPQPAAFVPFVNAIPAPPPPPPAEHYFVFNPYVAGYDCYAHRDLSRTLWFKAGVPVDVDAVSENLDVYTEHLRDFRTNFLVHLRHEITKLPEAWARDYQMGPESLRRPWTRPPKPLPRRDINQAYTDDTSSGSNGASWDPDHGASRHNPQAIRLVCGRLPEHIRDGPYTDPNVVLRDGRHVALQIMGLPISKQMRTWRYQQRMRMARDKHAVGELTAREAIEAEAVQDRRCLQRERRQMLESCDSVRLLEDRRIRNSERDAELRTGARAAREAERSQLNKRREAQEAVRRAARRRLSSEDAAEMITVKDADVDEGSEADTEEDVQRHRVTKPKVRSKVNLTPSPRTKPVKARHSSRAQYRGCASSSSSRQQGRMELYYGMRDGMFDDEGDEDDENFDSDDYDDCKYEGGGPMWSFGHA
ncbi:hypothetical protein SCUCBS95973_001995 [Sporothrix curviconia]|uniref:Uncharacterized protein n=1 Tax=Sporothrix curviconia TaxID=1260050 RepID=A0ABP0B428_9PEZI